MNTKISDPVLPDWFTPTPFAYQATGITKILEGHTLVADEPGLGKTLQALGAAVALEARRVTVICPPILVTNWAREIRRTGHLDHIPGGITTITADTTPPDADQIANAAYVVTSDALLVARTELAKQIQERKTDVLILDEAHRFKNPKTKRTKTVAKVTATSGRTIALTGTPIISTPLDLLPLLAMLGKLHWFPGNSAWGFTERYTVKMPWGGRVPRKNRLAELHALCDGFVWVRRTKADVLTDLPAKMRTTQTVTPTHADLTAANSDIHAAVARFISTWDGNEQALDAWAGDNLKHISRMRRAAGLAKIEAANEWICEHIAGAPERPLIAWAVHKDVITRLAAVLIDNGIQARVINGDTPSAERDQIVADFQAGSIDVLIGQIIAAGVGLTLTRSSDVLFVETDWTPANVVQAEDRVHRIGQHNTVQITTLVADDTLDGHIHTALTRSIEVLDQVTPGSDHEVTSGVTGSPAKDILARLAIDAADATKAVA